MGSLAVGRFGILVASLCAALSGCMAIPYPIPPLGYTQDSRHNLSDAVPAFIVQGQTSREEVLYKLGEPDDAFNADQTFVYISSNARGGGGILVIPMIGNSFPDFKKQRMLHRRLIVEFDTSGHVTSATSATKTCSIRSRSRDLLTERESVSVEECPDSPKNPTP